MVKHQKKCMRRQDQIVLDSYRKSIGSKSETRIIQEKADQPTNNLLTDHQPVTDHKIKTKQKLLFYLTPKEKRKRYDTLSKTPELGGNRRQDLPHSCHL